MSISHRDRAGLHGGRHWKHVILGGAGILLGGVFLWLAVRDLDLRDIETVLRQLDPQWLIAGVAIYLASIGVRCLRWGVLLRATVNVKWRHASEALVTGFAANFVLPGRVGELFRVDYARRVFHMSRFTSFGTIVVERVCDGIVLVGALWGSFAWVVFTRVAPAETFWILMVGTVAGIGFAVGLALILASQRIDVRRLGVAEGIATRWDQLVKGISSVLRGNAMTVVLCSIGIAALDALTLASVVRSFDVSLSLPESLMLLGLASLSTLVPTAPGYAGTYQLVFGKVFRIFGHPQSIGVIAATAVQLFCFGTVTILGGIVLLSRSGVTIWRAHKLARPEGSPSSARADWDR